MVSLKILYCGDVVGRSGRDIVLKEIPKLREELALDFIVVSSDNAAGGFGVTPAECRDFFEAGVDVLTGGDHIWDQREIVSHIGQENRLLRPLNFPKRTPGTGMGIYETKKGKKVAVLHLLGQVFHKEHLDCPFAAAEAALSGLTLKGNVDAILVDMHAEATSEKNAMGHFLDGKVSAVVGSHTHVPTHDARIFDGGTGYLTDAGMCGDYNSVIGFRKDEPIQQFLTKMRKAKLEPAKNEGTLCGIVFEINEKGLTESLSIIRRGKILN